MVPIFYKELAIFFVSISLNESASVLDYNLQKGRRNTRKIPHPCMGDFPHTLGRIDFKELVDLWDLSQALASLMDNIEESKY